MFRIECFCDDTKLGKVLWALNGLAYDVTQTPVANAKNVGGKVHQVNGSAAEVLMAGIAKHRLKEVDATDIKAIMVEKGFAEGGYSNALKNARELGWLKALPSKSSKFQRYRVTAKARSASAS